MVSSPLWSYCSLDPGASGPTGYDLAAHHRGDGPARQPIALPWRMLRLGEEASTRHRRFGSEVEHRDVGRRTGRQPRRGPAHDLGWAVLQQPEQPLEGKEARVDQPRVEEREADLEVGDAERGGQHVLLLLGERVGCVVRTYRVDDAVHETRPQGLHVLLATQRWRDLEERVEAAEGLVREREVMWCHLQGHRRAAAL